MEEYITELIKNYNDVVLLRVRFHVVHIIQH